MSNEPGTVNDIQARRAALAAQLVELVESYNGMQKEVDGMRPWLMIPGGSFHQGLGFTLVSFAPTLQPVPAGFLVAAALFLFYLAHLDAKREALSARITETKRDLELRQLLLTL